MAKLSVVVIYDISHTILPNLIQYFSYPVGKGRKYQKCLQLRKSHKHEQYKGQEKKNKKKNNASKNI